MALERVFNDIDLWRRAMKYELLHISSGFRLERKMTVAKLVVGSVR